MLSLGPDHATVDGGIIVDPPDDFPHGDLTAASTWAEKRRVNHETERIRIYRFDVKMGIGSLKSGQWAPFFLTTLPEFPEFVCIVPIRCWHNLYHVDKRRLRAGFDHLGSPLRTNQELVFSDLLAPFAVHQDDLYDAFIRIVQASEDKTVYINPTNGVELHGWCLPSPDTTTHNVLEVREKTQDTSRLAIVRLLDFIDGIPGISVALNPISPLVCDMFLIDEIENTSYNLEHKHAVRQRREELEFEPEWSDIKYNWHFLFHQCEDELIIHTRGDGSDPDSTVPGPRTINMADQNGNNEFTEIIRAHGPMARSRLLQKWKTTSDYDASVETTGTKGEEAESAEVSNANLRSHHMQVAYTGLLFRDKINEQCCKLGLHACILLYNNPCADAIIVEHIWQPGEIELYRSSGLVPVSLAMKSIKKRCIAIRFLPHRVPAESISTDSMPIPRLFEPAINSSWEVPVCTAQDFVYVATTGHIPTLNQVSCLDTVILLPSTATDILPTSRTCKECEERPLPREWTYFQPRVVGLNVERKNQWSLLECPFLKHDSEPLNRLYTVDNGSVHEYFCKAFTQDESRLITTLHGPSGILQRQWNHGDVRLVHDLFNHPTYQ